MSNDVAGKINPNSNINPLDQFGQMMTTAVNFAMHAGIPPFMVIGLMSQACIELGVLVKLKSLEEGNGNQSQSQGQPREETRIIDPSAP